MKNKLTSDEIVERDICIVIGTLIKDED